jgi:hypothetical protein
MSTLSPIAAHKNCSDQDAGGTDQRRRWFTILGLGALAVSALPLAMPGTALSADSEGKGKGKGKGKGAVRNSVGIWWRDLR